MKQILLFAGTTEGRELAEWIGKQPQNWQVFVSTATEYGSSLVEKMAEEQSNIIPLCGRMDLKEIKKFIEKQKIELVIDATHPFATEVTENLQKAATLCKVKYIRLLREETEKAEGIIEVRSVREAADFLSQIEGEGKILITTGSKELAAYAVIPNYRERCYARVLSTGEAVADSIALGFEGAHLIAMQGPFSKELNSALIRHTGAKYFVTKESGKAGGFDEKVAAAKETGAVLVVIRRPKENGMSPKQVRAYLGGCMEKAACQRVREQEGVCLSL